MVITEDHIDDIQSKILSTNVWDASIPATLCSLFDNFVAGAGHRIDTYIIQLYMMNIYKIPITLTPLTPNITATLMNYYNIANADIATLIDEETLLFEQTVDRVEQTIASLAQVNTTFVRETLGNLTSEFRERCIASYGRFNNIYDVHVNFTNFVFNANEQGVAALAEPLQRFRFYEFVGIEDKIEEAVERLRMQGAGTFEMLLEQAWFVAVNELVQGITTLKADIMAVVDEYNEFVAPGLVFYTDAQRRRVDGMEQLVIEAFENIKKRTAEFGAIERKFMDEARRVHALNATLAEAIYDADHVLEPQYAYIVTGIQINGDVQKIFDEFYLTKVYTIQIDDGNQ